MTSKTEIRDLLISVIVLALAFSRFNIEIFPVMLLIIVLVFVFHELAHRYVAQRYGCFAEYRIWPIGIALSLLSVFTGIIFAAPGAVYISPYSRKKSHVFAFSIAHLTRKEYGKISIAGPLTNIIVGLASLITSFFYTLELFLTISQISFFLAFFNLLPIFPLDGSKVMAWNMKIWIITFAVPLVGLALILL